MSGDIVVLILALLVMGAMAGFAAGLFGIGGGTIMVPAQFYVLQSLGYDPRIIMHVAVATSSAVIIFGSMRSVARHHKHGAVDWDLLWPRVKVKSWGLWIGLGAFLASAVLAPRITTDGLVILFAAIMALIALQFIFGRPGWHLRDTVPTGLAIPPLGSAIGGLSALMGIGGGAITVSLMVMCGKRVHRAIGTAAGIGTFISLPAALGFMISGYGVEDLPPLSIGYVNVVAFGLLLGSAILFIPIGADVAHRTNQNLLKKIFGVFLLVLVVNMARQSLF